MINCALEQRNLLEKDSGPVENSGYEKKKKKRKFWLCSLSINNRFYDFLECSLTVCTRTNELLIYSFMYFFNVFFTDA